MAITWADKEGRVRITHIAQDADHAEVIERLKVVYSLVPGHTFYTVDDDRLYTRIAELGGNGSRYPETIENDDYDEGGQPTPGRISRFRWTLDENGLPVTR